MGGGVRQTTIGEVEDDDAEGVGERGIWPLMMSGGEARRTEW
jgi:hypothetical protein